MCPTGAGGRPRGSRTRGWGGATFPEMLGWGGAALKAEQLVTSEMMRQKGCRGLNLGSLPVHLQRKVKITEGGGEMHATLMKTVSRFLGAGLCAPPATGCTSGGPGHMPEAG